VLAAIDVGSNAVRLKVARLLPDASLETLHEERDPVRPGEGVFTTGRLDQEVVERLLSTLRRYAALCRRYQARVRAVATSALREASNGAEVARRIRERASLPLEIISGREEARLICLGVLHGSPPQARGTVIDIGGGSTEVITALGEHPKNLWSVPVGAVRLTDVFSASGSVPPRKLALMRAFVREAFDSLPRDATVFSRALGSSGTINAVVGYAARQGKAATREEVAQATEELAEMPAHERRQRFDARRAEIIVAGAVILECAMQHLRLTSVYGVNRGLRDGVLIDLFRRSRGAPDESLADAALSIARRFGIDVRHAGQVARLALELFDRAPAVHRMPPSARPLLEAAALLHDIGSAISSQAHHKHSCYLIQNADLPVLSARERDVCARIARYHRRSHPDPTHAGMDGLTARETMLVRKLSTLLRIADALDRSHHQPVRSMAISVRPRVLSILLRHRDPVDLELWDVDREATLFRRVFRRRLEIHGKGSVNGSPARRVRLSD
jgi:exopolyphosphatase/guanosine-5'-triphosphate,3'-diphosphate pyrophosphatase